MIEAEILGLTQVQGVDIPAVLLQHEELILPINIGPPEANAIQMALMEEKAPRPMTHDLICNLLAGLRGTVQSVAIYSLEEQTFFAYLNVEQTNEEGEVEQILRVDTRPSDGIAIALRVKCPILVDEAIFEEAGHDVSLLHGLFDDEQGEDTGGDDEEDDIPDDDEEDEAF